MGVDLKREDEWMDWVSYHLLVHDRLTFNWNEYHDLPNDFTSMELQCRSLFDKSPAISSTYIPSWCIAMMSKANVYGDPYQHAMILMLTVNFRGTLVTLPAETIFGLFQGLAPL